MELLTRQQAARMLQVSVRQFDRFVASGLPVVRFNSLVRVREEDLRRWVDGRAEMTSDQILKTVEAYKSAVGIPAKKSETGEKPMDRLDIMAHVAWMCNQIPGFLAEGKGEKVNRWLGFIQGALWSLGIRTIDQMRDDNR
jgi:hypothetical protein